MSPITASSRRAAAVPRLLADFRVRFLVVGAINTVCGYLVYAAVYWLLGSRVLPTICLVITHGLYSPVAFVLYRRYVFKVEGNLVKDFLRFQSVYVVSFAANVMLLWLTTSVLNWNPYVAQAIVLGALTICSYVGHRFFSFRR